MDQANENTVEDLTNAVVEAVEVTAEATGTAAGASEAGAAEVTAVGTQSTTSFSPVVAAAVAAYLTSVSQPTTEEEAFEIFYRLPILVAPWALEKLTSVKAKHILCEVLGSKTVCPGAATAPAVAAAAVPEPTEETLVEKVDDLVKSATLSEPLDEVKKMVASPLFMKMISKCWTK
jgi:hypothetical protein